MGVSFRGGGAGVGDENAEACRIVRPLCRTYFVARWTDDRLCDGYKWVSRFKTPCVCIDGRVSAEWSRCPCSMARRARDSVAPLRRSSAGWMPARIGRLSAGVGSAVSAQLWPPNSDARRKFSWGCFIQRHMVVIICIWCSLFVTSQFDAIFMFPNQRFGGVCWHNMNILLHALPLIYVSWHWICSKPRLIRIGFDRRFYPV